MTVNSATTVRELALGHPSSAAVLERYGIDYCCGGHVPFEEACAKAGRNPQEVLQELERAAEISSARQGSARDWANEPLADLIAHISSTHHVYVRTESPRLLQLANKVAAKHGPNHAELAQVERVFTALAEELSVHLMKEEQILFPYIVRAEESAFQKEPVVPSACFGSVENPIRMMMTEHDSAGDALRELRRLTNDYAVPSDACASYRAMLQGFVEFEADLHQHIHLENNILFPRAMALGKR